MRYEALSPVTHAELREAMTRALHSQPSYNCLYANRGMAGGYLLFAIVCCAARVLSSRAVREARLWLDAKRRYQLAASGSRQVCFEIVSREQVAGYLTLQTPPVDETESSVYVQASRCDLALTQTTRGYVMSVHSQ